MFDQPSSPYRSLMISAAIMAAFGWLGLVLLLLSTVPTVGPRWLFFFLLAVALTGTALPFVWVLHRRFDSRQNTPASTLLRQALLFALFGEICAWLQINRSLTLSLAVLLAVGLAAVEWFLRTLERNTRRGRR
ncbi:MAG: hypothetical protein P8X64_03350 [Anaerolineales bacterium]|jgi:hypothetical protein